MPERSHGSNNPRKTPRQAGSPGSRPGDRAAASEFAGLGITMGLAIALFAVAGNWLDGRLGTKPLFVLLGVFLGFGAGFYSMYSRLLIRRRENDENDVDGSRD